MDNKDYDSCYGTMNIIGLMTNTAGNCTGKYASILDMTIDLDCLSCPYLDPLRTAMWKSGTLELDTEEDPQPKFIRNACLAVQMNAGNVDEEDFCFGSMKDGDGKEVRNTCKHCIYFVKKRKN